MDAESGVRQAPESMVGACKSWRSRPRGMMLAGSGASSTMWVRSSRSLARLSRRSPALSSTGRSGSGRETSTTQSGSIPIGRCDMFECRWGRWPTYSWPSDTSPVFGAGVDPTALGIEAAGVVGELADDPVAVRRGPGAYRLALLFDREILIRARAPKQCKGRRHPVHPSDVTCWRR